MLLEPSPGSSSPRSNYTSMYLSPLHLSLGNGLGLQWRKKARIRNSGSKLTMWLQILGARGESEMGRVSLFL